MRSQEFSVEGASNRDAEGIEWGIWAESDFLCIRSLKTSHLVMLNFTLVTHAWSLSQLLSAKTA